MQNDSTTKRRFASAGEDTAARGMSDRKFSLSCKTEARSGGGSHLHPLRVTDQVLLSR